MRSLFGVLSLVVALAVVGLLVKKQLTSTQQALPSLSVPAPAVVTTDDVTAPQTPGAVKTQSQQVQQQYKQALEQAMQQPRVIPDEK